MKKDAQNSILFPDNNFFELATTLVIRAYATKNVVSCMTACQNFVLISNAVCFKEFNNKTISIKALCRLIFPKCLCL